MAQRPCGHAHPVPECRWCQNSGSAEIAMLVKKWKLCPTFAITQALHEAYEAGHEAGKKARD